MQADVHGSADSDAVRQISSGRAISTRSSSTQIGVDACGPGSSVPSLSKEKEALGIGMARPDDGNNDATVGDEAGAQVFPVLSKLKAISLVATLTAAMILNSSSYSLAFGSLLLLFGRLADIHGHKLVFTLGMGWFCIWSIAVGLAPNEISIDLFRAFQGMGAGAAIPAALGILGSSFAPSQAKSAAFATFSAGAPIGGSLGCVFGGVFTQYATWRAIFYVSAGLAALICVAGYFVIPPDHWKTPYIPVLFCVGIIMIAAFWFWEKHVEFGRCGVPLMRTSLWHKGKFAPVMLLAGLGWAGFSSFMFFSTLWFQDFEGLTPIMATVRFLPSPVTGIVLNVLVQRVSAPYWEFQFPSFILVVFGADFVFSVGIMYVSKIAGPGEQALAGGVFNMVTQVGTAIGLAIMTVIQAKVTASEVERLGGVYNPNSVRIISLHSRLVS
ncbi:hypothetical protein RQP46_007765 [Phenoliferia psychrophenolica]